MSRKLVAIQYLEVGSTPTLDLSLSVTNICSCSDGSIGLGEMLHPNKMMVTKTPVSALKEIKSD